MSLKECILEPESFASDGHSTLGTSLSLCEPQFISKVGEKIICISHRG